MNDVRHEYYLDGSRIIKETWANQTLEFLYDENNSVYCIVYTGGDGAGRYYLIKNLQGDVTRILNNNLETVAQYVYDPWGKLVYILDADGEPNSGISIANINPIRYRGYYFDMETGFYYLNARYYDPALGRFINPDSFVTTGQGLTSYNMYAYCGNNPVNRTDPDGHFWITALITLAATACMALLTSCSSTSDNYGAASPYVPSDSQEYNCYAYVLGERTWRYVGGRSGAVKDYDVDKVAQTVLDDLQKEGRSARIIDSYDSEIKSNEYRIALRTGKNDYHFMVQHNDGSWSHKPGICETRLIDGANPSVVSWDLPQINRRQYYMYGVVKEVGYVPNYYNSKTVYLAITR